MTNPVFEAVAIEVAALVTFGKLGFSYKTKRIRVPEQMTYLVPYGVNRDEFEVIHLTTSRWQLVDWQLRAARWGYGVTTDTLVVYDIVLVREWARDEVSMVSLAESVIK